MSECKHIVILEEGEYFCKNCTQVGSELGIYFYKEQARGFEEENAELKEEIAKWKRLVERLRSNATAVEARHEDTVEKLESMIDPQTLKEYKDLLQQKANDEMIRYFLNKEQSEK